MVHTDIEKLQQRTERNMLILIELQDKLKKVHRTNEKGLSYFDNLPMEEEILKRTQSLRYYDMAIISILGVLSSLPEIQVDTKGGKNNVKRNT